MKTRHTRSTPAGVPRGRSKLTRAERGRRFSGYIARKRLSFAFDLSRPIMVTFATFL